MDEEGRITRRDFIRNSVIAGGGMLLSNNIAAGNPGNPSLASGAADNLLKGVCDIHLHATPDSRERSVNEMEFARDAYRAGYRAVMFKSNDFSCHDRAFLIRQELPDFESFGSLCMNRVHGDKVNVYAAEKAVKTSGNYCRCIWMPTLDAVYQYACMPIRISGR